MTQNKKVKIGLTTCVAVVAAVFCWIAVVQALSVGDDFSTAAKVSQTWHTTVDTSAGVARLATKSCDSAVWYCGAGYDNVIASGLGDGSYVLVAKVDIGSPTTKQWKTTQTSCDRPQCSTDGGQDGDNLKADNTLSFTAYSARDACKAIGGRLPTKAELSAIYTNKALFGTFQSSYYWSASEYNATYAWDVRFSDGYVPSYSKDSAYYVRCVSGW